MKSNLLCFQFSGRLTFSLLDMIIKFHKRKYVISGYHRKIDFYVTGSSRPFVHGHVSWFECMETLRNSYDVIKIV